MRKINNSTMFLVSSVLSLIFAILGTASIEYLDNFLGIPLAIFFFVWSGMFAATCLGCIINEGEK